MWEEQRHEMVNTLAFRGIHDPHVLRAMGMVPREKFVPSTARDHAYADGPLPIGWNQTISQPYIVAYMCEVADLKSDDLMLDIGTGSGYAAAVCSRIVNHVYTIERIEELSVRAQQVCAELGYDNISYQVGDGSLGWEEHAPYDAIITTAAAPSVPEKLLSQLSEGGRLVIPLGDFDEQWLVKISKHGNGFVEKRLEQVRFVPLIGKEGMH